MRTAITLAILTFAAIFSQIQAVPPFNSTKCRGIALQGGGDRGAYQAGVVKGFIENAKSSEDFQWDVATGVSAGSINTLGILMFEKGDEAALAKFLPATWLHTNKSNIVKSWRGGYVEGLFFKPALFDNNPELPFLKGAIFTEPTKRAGIIVTTDIKTATKVAFTNNDWETDKDIAAYAALFSSAIPFAFIYRDYENYTFIDGGWSESMDVEDTVLTCKDKGYKDQDIIVDVVWCFNHSQVYGDTQHFNALQMWSRAKDISAWKKGTFLYNYTVQAFPEVDWRYAMIPSTKPPFEVLPLEFDDKKMEIMINSGIHDAKAAIAEGEKVSAKRLLKYAEKSVDAAFFNSREPIDWNEFI